MWRIIPRPMKEKWIKMGKKEMDFSNPDFIELVIREGFDEINEMREKLRKEEVKKTQQEVDNIIFFHKEFEDFKFWIKGRDPMTCEPFKPGRQADANKHLICLSENFTIPMDRHHVNVRDVVYVPTLIHRAINHKQGDGKLEGVIG